jgi:outer membrane protein assembly factor BamD (BamD/ComL family)
VGKGRETDANNAYSDAAAYYEKIESQNRGKMLGYAASTLMFQAYMNLKNHEKAGTIVEDIIRNYPSGMAFMQFLPYVEMIFVKTLNRPEKAIEIFEEVRKKVRDKELIKILQKKIDELRGQRK